MGANVKEKREFYSISAGRVVKKVPEGTENAVERTSSKGNVSYVLEYGSLNGTITSLSVRDTDFGMFLNIGMQDGIDQFTLSLNLKSKLFSRFAKTLPNIDLEKEIYIGAFPGDPLPNGGIESIISFNQDRMKVEQYYTKDTPHDLPAPTKTVEMGKDKWDYSKQNNFLYELILKYGKQLEAPVKEEPKPKVQNNEDLDGATDDLPF